MKSSITISKKGNSIRAKGSAAAALFAAMTEGMVKHEHPCHCGTATKTPHKTGEDGCVRFITDSPVKVFLSEDMWSVDGAVITGFTMREQRGYHQHPCGCWSRHGGSSNSIED